MNTPLKIPILFLAVVVTAVSVRAQSTAFTYHGILNRNRAPVTGEYDMRFAVYDANLGGVPVAGPLPKNAVGVTNGLFTVRIDFMNGIFTGPPRWIEVSVRPAGNGNFETLSPRQELTSSPYSIRALTAGTASDVSNGSVVKSLNNLRDNVTLAAGQNVTLTPSGNTLTIAAPGGVVGGPWSLNGASAYYNGGNVGVGTTEPTTKLAVQTLAAQYGVEHTDGARRLSTYVSGTGGWFGTRSSDPLHFFVNDGSSSMTVDTTGNIGVGNPSPAAKLDVNGNVNYGQLTKLDVADNFVSTIRAADLFLGHPSRRGAPGRALVDFGDRLVVNFAGDWPTTVIGGALDTAEHLYATIRAHDLLFGHPTRHGAPGRALVDLGTSLHVNFAGDWGTTVIGGSKTSVRSLEITGGADIAEPFKMSSAEIPKGSVVVIDEQNPGHLKLSTEAYDSRVAGVVSGANGIKPGISLHQEGAIQGGENVALSGRVYVHADASFGVIKPGDLLTTSDTPGHAMKVGDHAKAQGAILGKAMSALKEGKGMVLVLVTLQ